MSAASPPLRGLATAEEIIEEARNGRMFILVDDEDRENEGDLVIPAQMATPEAINFMARHGRGLICLAMTQARVNALGLPQMSPQNETRHATAFTVSIEALEGVTTGISASDRARTIAVAIDAAKDATDIVTPGHVFPLMAQPGGVLVRAGHTEAAVDVARLAGLNASGVICEILRDDGTMARLDDLIPYAERHGLKIGTIRDLIAYRRRYDSDVRLLSELPFQSSFGGDWRAVAFGNRETGSETLALVKGVIDPDQPTLVRMHQFSLVNDALGGVSERSGLLEGAMRMISGAGRGVVVILNKHSPVYMSTAMKARAAGVAPETLGTLRDYGAGAQILAELGIHQMILLSSSPQSPIALSGYGLEIVEQRPIELDLAN